MEKIQIKPFDIISDKQLPEMILDRLPGDGDPLEIGGDLYFVCNLSLEPMQNATIRVIPLIVRNTAYVKDIDKYFNCLSLAHQRVRFRNDNDASSYEELAVS